MTIIFWNNTINVIKKKFIIGKYMDNIYIFISLIVGLLFGVMGFLFLVYLNNKRSEDARSEANLIIENALKRETEILVEAKEKALNTLSKADKELNSRKF
ncbi:MAG: hypothetical protein CL730_04445 [Chloroflexi bacterium]|nr:hypothetical protein [Chloroflexota bacterium]